MGTIYLIPLRLEDCDIPDIQLSNLGISLLDIQWIDFWKPDGFNRLLKAIEVKKNFLQAEISSSIDVANSKSKTRFAQIFIATIITLLGLSSILIPYLFKKIDNLPLSNPIDSSPSTQDLSGNLTDQVPSSSKFTDLESISPPPNIPCDETLNLASQKTLGGYLLTHLTNDVLLSVEKRTDGRLFVGAYGKENSNFSEYEMELPFYLYVSSGWQKRKYEDGIYGVWEGCYAHFCPYQKGAAIYDCHTQRFYTIHFVGASSRNDREEERNTLNGASLPDEVNYVNFPLGKPPDDLLSNVWETLSLEKANIVDGRLCSRLYCDGGNQPPNMRNQSPLIEQIDRSLEFYGLAKKMPYSQARRILIQRDWQPEHTEETSTQFPEFPEVSCGNAICSAFLRKGNQKIYISLSHDLEIQSIGEELLN